MMQSTGRLIRLLIFLAVIGWGLGNANSLSAQSFMNAVELENNCQFYADKAVMNADEWENLQCGKKMSIAPQLLNKDRMFHFNRCMDSAARTFSADLKSMEKALKACRANTD